MLSKKTRIPLLKCENGVIIGSGDNVYLTYMGQDQRPYRLRAFVVTDNSRLCLEVDATSPIPLPEQNTPIRVTWPITESHEGYTFASRLIGLVNPEAEDGLLALIIQIPDTKDVRKMDNRRNEIRINARWPATIAWKNEKQDFSISGMIHNISFTGCSVYIPTKRIEKLGTTEAILSFFLSDRFIVSMQPLRELIGAKETDGAEEIFKPYANFEAMIRGRTKTVYNDEDVEVISFQLAHERRQLNQLIINMQLHRKTSG